MKKILTMFVVCFALSFVCFSSMLHKTVEISFRVGDSILLINGEEKNVETPYVVGDGVTLVPVRVITEAFGADVGWEQNEKKVTLSADGKKIELWIDKDSSFVDGKENKLLSAPELTNNVTMVPLRFISENFGADVSYDKETKSILVIKDMGPVVENGMQFFDDGIIKMSVPKEYEIIDEKMFDYTFAKSLKHNYNEYDTIWSYYFSVPALSDVEDILTADRMNQNEIINDKKYVVSNVEKNMFGDIEVFSYSVLYKKNTSSFMRVKKTMYNFGGTSYFTISAYDTYYNTADLVRKEEKLVSIDYYSYSISVPEEFSQCNDVKVTSFDISGKANPKISVSVYAKEKDFDAKSFLEQKENSYRYIIDQININASRVKEYTFDDTVCYGLELSYINGGKIYNILSEYNDYIAVFEFQQGNFEDAKEVIQSFELCDKEQSLSKLKKPNENSFITIEAKNFTFELLSDFVLENLENGGYVYGVDTQTSMFFNYYDGIKTVANESYDYSTGSDFNPMFPKIYTSILRKSKLADVTLDAIKLYENDGWEIEYNKRRCEDFKRNGEYIEVNMDEIISKKSIGTNVDVYQKIIFIFTDTDEYEISGENARVKRISEIVENNDFTKEYNMPDQKVHALVFTYTNFFNEKYVNELFDSLIDSMKLK